MTDLRAALQQHLGLALQAYGADLVLPAGHAVPRVAAPMPADLEPSEPFAAAPAPGPAPSPADPLQVMAAEVAACTRCGLHKTRTRTVFGEGSAKAMAMFVGEGPGMNEDRQGRPFVGKAGELLTRILNNAMGLRRKDVYIANVVKCRPPENRTPTPDEAGACLGYLQRQIDLVRPKVIVCLGRTAAHHLLGRHESVGALRGKSLDYDGTPVVVTWHPAYLLRDESRKAETWLDIQRVNTMLGRPERPAAVREEA